MEAYTADLNWIEANRTGSKASFLGQWTLEWERPRFESQLFQLLAACGGKIFSSWVSILSPVKMERIIPPHQFSSVAQLCLTLWTLDCSTPGLPVHHQLPELTQTHVHWVGDVIQPSHPLLSPSPPTFNLSQHQGLFKWVSFSYQVAKVLEF